MDVRQDLRQMKAETMREELRKLKAEVARLKPFVPLYVESLATIRKLTDENAELHISR